MMSVLNTVTQTLHPLERELLSWLLHVKWAFSRYQLDEQQWLPTFRPAALAFFRRISRKLVWVMSIYKHARNQTVSNKKRNWLSQTRAWPRSVVPCLLSVVSQQPGTSSPMSQLRSSSVDVWIWRAFFSWSSLDLPARSITLVSCHLMGWWCSQACSATVDFSSIPLQQASWCSFILVSSFLVVSPM